jgi:2-isopropylmalate synthase
VSATSDPDVVRFFDTTLRDGEQAPGIALTKDEKVEIAEQLARLHVDILEAGFAISSDGEFDAVREIATSVKGPVIASLARVVPGDIERAAEALKGADRWRIHVFISTSQIHMEDMLRMSHRQVLDGIEEGVKLAAGYTEDVEFSAQDATRTELAFLLECFDVAVKAGATTINVPDTVGYATPAEFGELVRIVRERTPDHVTISTHCHNDLGLAVANSLAAIQAGARQVECTVNGIGERAGNAALEEIVIASQVRGAALQFRCNVEPREIYRTSQLLSYLTGVFPQPNKAIVGRNAFAHEAGIHQHGMLQNGLTYEIIRPEMVGIPRSTLVLGKHSGRHGLERRFSDLGYDLDEEQLNEVYREFIALADRKREILDEDLLALLHDSFHDAPEEYQMTHLRVVCGSVSPTAEVRMAGAWTGERAARGTGYGPIAAAFTAISEITGRQLEVMSLQLRSLTPGRDSVGQVFLQVKVDGKSLSGHGASTDIVEASARALVNALNKARHADRLESSSLNSVYLWGV